MEGVHKKFINKSRIMHTEEIHQNSWRMYIKQYIFFKSSTNQALCIVNYLTTYRHGDVQQK